MIAAFCLKSLLVFEKHSDPAKAMLERAALLQHKTLSAYLLESALQKAKSDLRESEIITLHERDREKFFSALVSPPATNEVLKDLFKEN